MDDDVENDDENIFKDMMIMKGPPLFLSKVTQTHVMIYQTIRVQLNKNVY